MAEANPAQPKEAPAANIVDGRECYKGDEDMSDPNKWCYFKEEHEQDACAIVWKAMRDNGLLRPGDSLHDEHVMSVLLKCGIPWIEHLGRFNTSLVLSYFVRTISCVFLVGRFPVGRAAQ